MMRNAAVVAFASIASALDNGLAIRPPMGWRSWNLYGSNVNQELMQGIMKGMTSRRNLVDGKPTSLLDLGYSTVGLDDNWQECGAGAKPWTYHDANGDPVVNTGRFPSLLNMTSYAHSLGLKAGWYGNNCICSDSCSEDKCYEGDVNATLAAGFDAIKLDGCGAEYDLQKWSDLFSSSSSALEIENCHWGETIPNATWCPFSFYRTSGDVRANFGSILGNLATVVPLAEKNLSTPGCWAYPDMLEVGCSDGPGGSSDSGLTMGETRSHFGGWCIVSSPLTLSHDVNNDTITDYIWPVIANPEALAVNQNYFGFSGSAFSNGDGPVAPGQYVVALSCNASDATQSGWAYDSSKMAITFGGQCIDSSTPDQVLLADCAGTKNQQYIYNGQHEFQTVGSAGNCLDIWAGNGPPGGPAIQVYGCHGGSNQEFSMQNGNIASGDNLCFASRSSVPGQLTSYYKPMSWDKTKFAVLLMNVASTSSNLAVTFSNVPGLVGTTCLVRDIWARKDLGSFQGSYNATNVGAHDSAFLMLTCS